MTTILEEAQRLVQGNRQDDYGHPAQDFAFQAVYWSNYLHRRGLLPQDLHLEPKDVAMMMVLLKVNRESHVPKRDNLVDAAGYLLTAAMVEERRIQCPPIT